MRPAVTDHPGGGRVKLIEEAQLFLEASHACQARLAARPADAFPATSTIRAQ